MESMTACRQRVQELRRQAKAQVDALRVLEKAFVKQAEQIRQHDQAWCLDDLRRRVTQEVEEIRRMETAASYGFTKAMLVIGVAKLAFGSLVAATLGTEEHPLSVGTKMAASDFGKTKPFGNVVVAVGLGGVPDDVNVISLSRYARELARSESEIVAGIEARGYCLTTPESFFKALDELKGKVLEGVLALPVVNAIFLLKRVGGSSE